jgi:hypothetical protein
MPSDIEILAELGYNGAEIHHIYTYYNMTILIGEPSEKRKSDSIKLSKLIAGKDKFYIDQAVVFGKSGLSYPDCRYIGKNHETNQ